MRMTSTRPYANNRLLIRLIPLTLFWLFPAVLMSAGTHNHSHDDSKFSVGEPDRIILVSMQDTMRFIFEPDLNTLKQGEVIEFVVRNDGSIRHEFTIGNAEDQVIHAEMMLIMPDMIHNDPNTISLDTGESGSLLWRFLGDDTVVFACNQLGHFEAGMKHIVVIKH